MGAASDETLGTKADALGAINLIGDSDLSTGIAGDDSLGAFATEILSGADSASSQDAQRRSARGSCRSETACWPSHLGRRTSSPRHPREEKVIREQSASTTLS